MTRALLIVLAAVALVACGNEDPTKDSGSGIRGTVVIGPTCPVQVAESPCADAPYEATISVTSGVEVVATGESSSDGTFRISVPPGTYTVAAVPRNGDAIAHAEPVAGVVVTTGSFSNVAISFDSGVR
jgi:hypothetical protein